MNDLTISMPPHIIIFPSPIEWPVTTMFDLAELLCISGLHVTFLLTPYTDDLLLHHFHVESRLNPYPNFHLYTISDGLPSDHPRSDSMELLEYMEALTKPIFRDVLTLERLSSDERGLVNCIISDGFMTFVYDVAKEIQVPVISALSLSPCSIWILSNLPNLTDAGEDSNSMIEGNTNLIIKHIPGIDGILTGDDLASMCQSRDLTDPSKKHLRKQMKELSRAHGLILNTFKALDGPILSRISSMYPNLYPIGPIHTHLWVRQEAQRMTPLLNYSIEENNNCIIWLESQQPKSVLYVNIENQAKLKWVQTRELWHGLVNSGTRFLWVRQPEAIEGRVPPKILKGTKERGCVVGSASNVQVLAHKAIGGFLTCGQWDSIIQGVVEGVPTICCPSSLDQEFNSRFVSKVWKIGLDVEWRWEKNAIEKMIRDVMGSKGELIENASKLKILARKSVRKGGSSYAMLDHLIGDIRFMHNGL
ncbi:hypothetical protein QVD17_35936 [Tagetes erecta]|uniref:Glycosyltransferase n=1 Tax=Tagetes erecta TaxID=13708 RepID=A0AAD8NBI3_TARER|nr:hypothetical protein QVD17_35936 [Tagetes erecta]